MLDGYSNGLRLRADAARVVVRPFHIGWLSSNAMPSRTERIVRDVLDMSETAVRKHLRVVRHDFEKRHWQTRKIFLKRFHEIAGVLDIPDDDSISEARRELIGAYFCHEYSYAAAALMNPSVVRHYDQTGLRKGCVRIILTLRAVGEGHISSIAFREGIITADHRLQLLPEPPFATATDARGDEDIEQSGEVTVFRNEDSTLSGTVIFPITGAQAKGLEDLRLVEFRHEDGRREWIGTYTAYNGETIRSELLRTSDFRSFDMCPLAGPAARNKGLALFPRKIGGKYHMIGRQDGENLFHLVSDTLEYWGDGELLLEPFYPWELVQMGNCGPPIETEHGWLLLTHGVGAMRKYSIGAVLLDLDDPSKVLKRTVEPILAAGSTDREGYVPNVVYTCGALLNGDTLFMPYGIADSSVAFAFIPLNTMIEAMVAVKP